MKTKSILQSFLLTLLLCVWGIFVSDANAQGCAFEDAYDSDYVQGIIGSDTAMPTEFGACFFTQQYVLFEYNGEAYVRKIAGYNSLNANTGVGCPGPDIADYFYDCEGNQVPFCAIGFAPDPADPDFCNALIAASAYGTVIWAVDGATTEPAIQKSGYYTYTACIGEELSIPIHQGGPGPAQPDPPCINDGTFSFSGAVDAYVNNGILTIVVDGPGEVIYSIPPGIGCLIGLWNITIEPTSDCEGFCIADDPFSEPFIQDIINDNNPCFAYSQIVEVTYNSSTYFRVEKIIAPTYSPDTCPAPDIVNTVYYDCEGNYICGFGFGASPTDPTLCDALVAATSSGTVIWENDFGTEPPVSSAPIFLNNPWLSSVVSEANCTNETVTVYQSGSFQFFYIENATGSTLYFEDGTFYCSDAPNFDCLNAYGLTTVVDTWTCGETGNSEMPCGVEDPLTLDFMIPWWFYNNPPSGTTCSYLAEIVQFELDGFTFFRRLVKQNTAIIQLSGDTCEPYDYYSFYDCSGEEFCAPWGATSQEFCDDLMAASQSGTIIYSYTPITINADCDVEDPFALPFIQETINTPPTTNSNGDICWYISEVIEFSYYGDDYFRINEGSNNFPLCTSETGSKFYDCDGNYLCGTGPYPSNGDFEFCNSLEQASNDWGAVIWSFDPLNVPSPSDCTIDDPLNLSFIQEIVNNPNQACITHTSISQVFYDDGTINFILASNPTGDLDCPADAGGGELVDCEGNYICGLLPSDPDFATCLDLIGDVSSIVIWENNDFPEECTGENSLSLPVIQEAINTEPLYDPSGAICSYVSEIVKFTYQSQFYYKITTDYTGAALCGVGDRFYDCEGNYICGTGSYTPVCSGITSVLDAASESGVVIWSAPVVPITNCIVEDPYSLDFLQPILNSSGSTEGCFYVLNVVQIEYNGSSYFRINNAANPVGTEGFPCPAPDISDEIYDCEGNYICGIGFAPSPPDPALCNAINLASPNGTIIWQSGGTPNPEPASPVFTDYPWLTSNNLVNANDCNGETATVYSSGIYNFIHIETDAGGTLYFQDGTYYCADAPNFSCVAAYGLNTVSAEWTCGDTPEPPNPTENNPLFEDYTWLNNIVNENDCSNESVSVYTTGTYEFIYIETDAGATLYFEDGTYYCADAPNFNCVAAYGLTSMIASWTCGDAPEPPNPTDTEPDFGDYTWLSNVIDENDCDANASVTVYTSGIYSFLHVESTDGLGVLYFQDGTFYCADAANFSCVSAYSLTAMDSQVLWTCDLGKRDRNVEAETDIAELADLTGEVNFRLFPNPSTGRVFVEVEAGTDSEVVKSEQIITVYDLNGRAIKQISLIPDAFNTKIEIDLTDFAIGIYMVELKTSFSSKVKRLIVN